jgi:hypothetical protein
VSYDISLLDPATKQTIMLDSPHYMRGGTYAIGGTYLAELNVTYNYGPHFRAVLDETKGIRVLYGMTGAESIPLLQQAIDKLKDDVAEDYWEPTEGNAKQALCQLLALATMRPDGVWDGD